MKVVICSINSKYIHSSLGPWYLKAAALEAGAKSEIEIIEPNINLKPDYIMDKLINFKADVLAFSCHIWNIAMIRLLLKEIGQRLPDIRIVLGGPEVSYNPLEIMSEFDMVDYIICGEGEEPFSRLLLALESSDCSGDSIEGSLKEIKGLCYRQGADIICNPAEECTSEPSNPYTEEYFNQLEGRIAYIETSRGCPFSCAFCLSGRKGNVRFFDLEKAKKNILYLANSGSKTIKFVDRTFNCHKERTKEIIRFIMKEATNKANPGIPAGVCFHFEVGADLFDQETIDLLNQAPVGLFQLEAGLQSFNGRTLEAIDRHTDLAKLKSNIIKLQAAGKMHMHIDLIAGLPYEDLDSFGHSFDQAYILGPQMLQLGFLKMLHGSKLRRQAEELGYVYCQEPPYEFISNPWISKEEKEILKLCEDALERLANSGRFARSLAYVLEASGMRPFTFFCEFGKKAGISVGVPLDEYTEWFYEYAADLPGVNKEKLRDLLVCDRLSCDNTGSLPPCLKIEDSRHKLVARALNKKNGYKKQPYRLFGFGLLYCGPVLEVAVADYRHKDPVTGCYPVEIFNYDELTADL